MHINLWPFYGAPEMFHMYAEDFDGQVRLVGGRAESGASGTWEYGRLEVVERGAWSPVPGPQDTFTAAEAHVACRSLGYATGSQLVAGRSSPLPSLRGGLLQEEFTISCEGFESSLSDCAFEEPFDVEYDNRYEVPVPFELRGLDAVALVCSNPSGLSPQLFTTS